MPKSIVVGIANIDRKRDFTHPTTIEKDKKRFPTTGHSDKFTAFLEKELQPFIEKKYKTNSSKSKNVKVHFDYLPQENHATIGHQAVFNGLKLLNSTINNKE